MPLGYRNLVTFADGPLNRPGEPDRFPVTLSFEFTSDMSPLFPYVNAVADRAELFDRPVMIRFRFQNVHCAVYPDHCLASPMESREVCSSFADALIAFLSEIRDTRDGIVPRPAPFKPGSVPVILKLLPGTNCGECGYRTCLAFAALLARQQADTGQCPHMSRPASQTFEILDKAGRPVSEITLHTGGNRVKFPNGSGLIPSKDVAPGAAVQIPSLPPGGALTDRETEVLALMARGLTNPAISRSLAISPHTVKSHVIHIFNKLSVNHRTQAVVWAARNRLI